MPELRDRYDHGAVSNWIIQPPLADLQDRARRRTRRHRATGAGAVAVLAGLVAVPLLTLPGGGWNAPGDPTSVPAWERDALSMAFYDLRHGVATYLSSDGCGLHLSATRDGGVTWSEPRALPDEAVAEERSSDGSVSSVSCGWWPVVPIAAETLVMPLTTETPSVDEWVEPLPSALISRDAGQTWQEYQLRLQTAEAVPDGVIPEPHCRENQCPETQLGWYDPQTGQPTVLRDNPPTATTGDASTVASVAADGTIWVAGKDAEDGYRVSVSRDRGHTWETGSLGRVDGAEPDDDIVLAAADGETAYLASRPLDEPGASSVLYRITDDGQTWHRLGERPFDVVAALWMAPDGTLALLDNGWRTHLSTDQGETFQDAGPTVQEVEQITGGFFGWAADDSVDPVDGYLSEDGLQWRPVRAP